MALPRLNGRQARWCMFLAPFDFEIHYQVGKRNPADAPSCRPDYGSDCDLKDGYLPTLRAKIARAKSYRIPGVSELHPELSVNCGRSVDESGCDVPPSFPVNESTFPTAFVMAAFVPHQVARQCVSLLDNGSFDGDIDDFVLLVQRLQQLDPEVQSHIINARSKDTPSLV